MFCQIRVAFTAHTAYNVNVDILFGIHRELWLFTLIRVTLGISLTLMGSTGLTAVFYNDLLEKLQWDAGTVGKILLFAAASVFLLVGLAAVTTPSWARKATKSLTNTPSEERVLLFEEAWSDSTDLLAEIAGGEGLKLLHPKWSLKGMLEETHDIMLYRTDVGTPGALEFPQGRIWVMDTRTSKNRLH